MKVSSSRRTVVTVGLVTFASIGLLLACGSDSKTGDPGEIPGGRTSSSGGEEAGPSEAAAPGLDCSGSAAVSDTPACDTCAKAQCCDHIKKCEGSDDCTVMQECLAACDAADPTCGLTCILAHEEGSDILQGLASCTTARCKPECGSPDAGDIDSPF